MKVNQTVLAVLGVSILTSLPVARGVAQAPATPDQMVAALKQNLAESQQRLRKYEWIETTALSLKGEEKSRKQQRVYYGADGKLTKLPIGSPSLKPRRRWRSAAVADGSSSRSSRTRRTICRTTWSRPPT